MTIINVNIVFNMDTFPETVPIHKKKEDMEKMEVGGMTEAGMLQMDGATSIRHLEQPKWEEERNPHEEVATRNSRKSCTGLWSDKMRCRCRCS